MKCLERNKKTFYYALYDDKVPLLDEDGYATGEYGVKYDKPKIFKANISPAKGETSVRQFGESVDYDKVIVLSDMSVEIDESTVLWVDKIPKLDSFGELLTSADGEIETPHDYVVKKVARSLNNTSIAISKVNVR